MGEGVGLLSEGRGRARTNTDEFFECYDDYLNAATNDDGSDGDGDEQPEAEGADDPPSIYEDRRCIDKQSGEVSHVPPGLLAGRPPKYFLKAGGSVANAR